MSVSDVFLIILAAPVVWTVAVFALGSPVVSVVTAYKSGKGEDFCNGYTFLAKKSGKGKDFRNGYTFLAEKVWLPGLEWGCIVLMFPVWTLPKWLGRRRRRPTVPKARVRQRHG